MKKNLYSEYCTGCGLCQSAYGVALTEGEDGYLYPKVTQENQTQLAHICPASGKSSAELSADQIWGRQGAVLLGWASDPLIRKQASSGGVLTALCCFLLDTHRIDGVIQTIAEDVYRTKTVISRTSEEVRRCMGSRYSISAPLREICQLLKKGERYAFVGKPCDVSALRLYLKEDVRMCEQIRYLLSFFCAGIPSHYAQKKLLQELGCRDERECVSLRYRGNGWPGTAAAVRQDGTVQEMSYTDSWGKILGRDVRKSCRFCLDGIGEFADISCGDAWYLDENGMPDFSEKEGRNVIFARTKAGEKLLADAVENGYLAAEEYSNFKEELKQIQRFQFERRAAMKAMTDAARLSGRCVPLYDRGVLKQFAKHGTVKLKSRRFLGTLKRAVKGVL